MGALDLRETRSAPVREMERLAARGVRAVRLFPDEAGEASRRASPPCVQRGEEGGGTLGWWCSPAGTCAAYWQPFLRPRGQVVFLDTHFYHLGDFRRRRR
ncbi:hypothetical protein GCM10020219_066800 [Nonomuraea dietziae]